ncbi:MAG: NUDIX domain-containing protein [Steroidobacteraceae bacterium]
MAKPRQSAGILLYRSGPAGLEVFLVHPGGPFWARKDAGAWSIPKGEYAESEDPLAAAQREFREETGVSATGPFLALRPIVQRGGKQVLAWASRGDLDPAQLQSNTFSLEWPPGSGTSREFPEVDRGAWFSLAQARTRALPSQLALLDELAERAAADDDPPHSDL